VSDATTLIDREAEPAAVIAGTVALAELPAWLGDVFTRVARYLDDRHAGPAGAPFARFRPLGGDRFEVEAGFPAVKPVPAHDDIEPIVLPGGPAVTSLHLGPYETVPVAYERVERRVAAEGGEPVGLAWECYLSEPDEHPERIRTLVVQPFRAVPGSRRS
jgi:effector-binding domain-containing protein